MAIITCKYRLKDGGGRKVKLRSMAGAVNFVWNYSNEFIRHRWKSSRFYSNKNDLHAVTKGSSKELPLHSQTVQAVYEELLMRMKKERKPIRFRTSKRNKNLGWIPFKASGVKFHGGYITYDGLRLPLWEHRKMPDGAIIKSGSFGEDSRGRWYVSIVIEIPDSEYIRAPAPSGSDVGIDPGLKTILTTSNGEKIERDNLTGHYEERLGSAQRHHKKRLAKKIHAKIKNRRLDFNHSVTEKLASKYETIYFGDAGSEKLKKTRMAKSVSDAGWFQIKSFLSYKTRRRLGRMLEISEKYSTVTCSKCLVRGGPSGLSGLSIREWTCPCCRAVHDRDVCSGENILRLGRETLNGKASKGSL